VERRRTTEAEELVHPTIPVLVTGGGANKNQLITPNSPQGVVAYEVYPYPPRFNQRTWRERCNAGCRPFRIGHESRCCAKQNILRDIRWLDCGISLKRHAAILKEKIIEVCD
jgi:hypothetical protein